MNEQEVKRGDTVEIDGRLYTVTATENYGFFVRGRQYIVLWTDEYKIVKEEKR